MSAATKTKKAGYRLKHDLELQRRTGIKVRLSFDEPQWWTEGLVRYTERIASQKQLSAAKNYVKAGKVIEMDVSPGLLEAKVQGRRKTPYLVRLYSPMPSEAQLTEIKRRLADRALYGAQLLSGEMPPAINEIFIASGAALLPDDYVKSQLQCTCPEPETICKHILAALYVATGVFDRDPFLLLKMRGLEKEALLSSLTSTHAQTDAPYPAPSVRERLSWTPESLPERHFFCSEAAPAEPLPLDVTFYGARSLPEELNASRNHTPGCGDIASAHVPLFDFPLWKGETSFKDSIAPYYESVERLFRQK